MEKPTWSITIYFQMRHHAPFIALGWKNQHGASLYPFRCLMEKTLQCSFDEAPYSLYCSWMEKPTCSITTFLQDESCRRDGCSGKQMTSDQSLSVSSDGKDFAVLFLMSRHVSLIALGWKNQHGAFL
ncbi:hypothetical protein XELAEV_18045492mg [Xenopus laevis]|uniref:Uncharacterized protein n=1 Tax=Xenopus laevis TaxID=8355 RepID=A0A974C0P7_XENLA|nr:hypothetical protein XELAEV_18045492mg [Xenopus laevis]